MIKLYQGNNIDVLKTFESNSVDTVITDPPYLLNFMNKKFDSQHKDLPGNNEGQKMQAWHTIWAKEVLRVIKPGGFMLAFGGSRTSHRLASALEDAGWELKDTVMFMFGTGFPKSTNIALNIQKAAEGHPQGSFDPTSPNHGNFKSGSSGAGPGQFMKESSVGKREITEPDALPWVGHGTALKPAFEPIIIAMKPCDGTYANNALVHGVAGLNIDAARIGTTKDVPASPSRTKGNSLSGSVDGSLRHETGLEDGHNPNVGRWPANVILAHSPDCVCTGVTTVKGSNQEGNNGDGGWWGLSEAGKGNSKPCGPIYKNEVLDTWTCSPGCPVALLDAQTGILKSGARKVSHVRHKARLGKGGVYGDDPGYADKSVFGKDIPGDSGGASRFFYCAKTSKKERGEGNSHPTVKPLALMEYLCKLTSTPTGGVILDPFAGSGSTLIAANNVSRDCIGIELEQDYCATIKVRLQERNIQFEIQEQLSNLW